LRATSVYPRTALSVASAAAQCHISPWIAVIARAELPAAAAARCHAEHTRQQHLALQYLSRASLLTLFTTGGESTGDEQRLFFFFAFSVNPPLLG
jgi:hypothetical protein